MRVFSIFSLDIYLSVLSTGKGDMGNKIKRHNMRLRKQMGQLKFPAKRCPKT
jgi:hypothetical protein